MFFSKSAIAAAVVFSSILGSMAQPMLHHNHHAHKRDAQPEDVVVVIKHVVDANGKLISVETSQVGSPATSAAAAANTDDSAAVAATMSFAAEDISTVNSPSPVYTSTSAATSSVVTSTAAASPSSSAAFSSSAASSSPAAPSSSSSSSSGSSGSFNGGTKGIVYSPYKVGGCKSADEVKSDLAKLTNYQIIRIYGVDCSQVENVKAALAPGQQLFLGIFDVADLQNGLKALISAIGNDWSVVHTISIGNELVNNGQASVDQIGSYVSSARSILSAAGYTGPVVSVDTFIAVINNPGLCQYSDYMAVNAHAYFDGNIAAEGAGDWVAQQIERVSSACGGSKKVLITESGWPHQGDSNGKAIASPSEQSAAISSIKSTSGKDCILFTAFDDPWKSPGLHGIEQFFGVM